MIPVMINHRHLYTHYISFSHFSIPPSVTVDFTSSGIAPLSSSIQDIMALQDAVVAYFYFDFKDTSKQDLCNVLRSLLTQLSIRSDSYCDILFDVHQAHNNGADNLSTKAMIKCLTEMLALPDQGPVYIVLDALDECPNTSGIPSAREDVLDFLKDLVNLRLSDLHICVSSRP